MDLKVKLEKCGHIVSYIFKLVVIVELAFSQRKLVWEKFNFYLFCFHFFKLIAGLKLFCIIS